MLSLTEGGYEMLRASINAILQCQCQRGSPRFQCNK